MTTDRDEGRRALVVGLGISGIGTAVALARAGWRPVLIEKASGRRSGATSSACSGRASRRRSGWAC
ncbi:FAD-dependent oxidoreductase [Kutzneria chonburiensis]|uniref:FAD-dependent oxidoreductase n=1 Tax=Kutzneria chonburiensis TaxID=1483604 RepID=UPI003081E26A